MNIPNFPVFKTNYFRNSAVLCLSSFVIIIICSSFKPANYRVTDSGKQVKTFAMPDSLFGDSTTVFQTGDTISMYIDGVDTVYVLYEEISTDSLEEEEKEIESPM